MYRLLLFVHFWELQPHEDEIPPSQAIRTALHDLTHEHATKSSPPITVETVQSPMQEGMMLSNTFTRKGINGIEDWATCWPFK